MSRLFGDKVIVFITSTHTLRDFHTEGDFSTPETRMCVLVHGGCSLSVCVGALETEARAGRGQGRVTSLLRGLQ